jgi:hypothetical protein
MEQPRESAPPPSLREALRRARAASAEKSGVLVELRTAELARLDLLKEQLEPVFAQVPQGVDLFDAAILPGDPARLFVDVLGFVEMGRDKRTYRFFNDTRYGRKLIAETESLREMTQAVTDYVAHRIVEREKALVSDLVHVPQPPRTVPPEPKVVSEYEPKGSLVVLALVAVIAGLLSYLLAGALWR